METTKGKILLDQVEELYTNLRYSNWAVILISSFLVWVLWPVSDHRILLGWDISVLFITLGRHVLAFLYGQSHITRDNVQFWLKAYILGVFISGVSWGLVPIFIVPARETFHLLVAVFLVAGLVTGSAATLASLKYGFPVFSIPAILPGAIYLIYINESLTFMIGCSLFAFLVFILFVALGMHKTIYYSLRQQVEIGNKLSILENEKVELDQKLEKLEQQLDIEREQQEKLRALLKHKKLPGTMVRRANEFRDERFLSLLENLKGGVWDINIKGRQALYSDGWLAMLGYDRNDVAGGIKFWENLLHPEDKLYVLNKLQQFIDGTTPEFSSSHRLKAKSGEWVWVMGRAYGVIWDDFGELMNIVCMEIFVPETGEITKQSLNLINFDIDEWLFSRENFDNRLLQLVKTAGVDGIEHSVCQLKIIEMNDTVDEDSSLDEVYFYEIGRLLLNQFRYGDAIVRMGNNGFALIMEFCKLDDAWDKAVALQKSLADLKVAIRGENHNITVAIGITPVSASSRTLPDIMRDAETACNMAVANTGNLVYLYQHDNEEIGANLFEKQYVQGLRDAVAANSLGVTATQLQRLRDDPDQKTDLYIVNVDTGRGLPDYFSGVDFHTVARNNSLFADIDLCVIRNVLARLEMLGPDEHPAIYLYECAEESYRDGDFLNNVIKQLNLHFQVISGFCFGISEHTVLHGGDVIEAFIEQIRTAGCKVALTEVGSTNLLASIKDYDLDFLKLGNTLLQDLEKDQSNLLTVKYINDIVHLKAVKSIVDGVDASLENTLRDINIDFLHDTSSDYQVSRIN